MRGTLSPYRRCLESLEPIGLYGKVRKMVGLIIESNGPGVGVGGLCEVYPAGDGEPAVAEVVGFRGESTLMMPLSHTCDIGPGSKVVALEERATLKVGPSLLGRVLGGLGEPIDGRGAIEGVEGRALYSPPLNPLERSLIREALDTGVRAINGLLTCGKGQRFGIFAGSGVGKSMLMGMIARQTEAPVNVIALIGERGREVREFIEKDLGEEGLRRSVVVTATSDEPALVRMRGAFLATAVAEYFRSRGEDVVLMLDSITRFAMAAREVGLAAGEPPTARGYTPSVFGLLPRLLERAGKDSGGGSITALYTVLVEGDDMNEPIADAVKAILDGHIVLSRELAARNHYPAIDVLQSKSRVMIDVVSPEHLAWAGELIGILADYRQAEDLINIGAYVRGTNARIDRAISKYEAINGYLRQDFREGASLAESVSALEALIKGET